MIFINTVTADADTTSQLCNAEHVSAVPLDAFETENLEGSQLPRNFVEAFVFSDLGRVASDRGDSAFDIVCCS